MLAPEAAADELERTVKDLGFHGVLVNGATDGLFLDDPRFEPILARAEALDLPIYIHPGIPAEAVRNAYYDGLPGNFSFTHGAVRLGLARGDRDPHAAAGAERRARPPSAAEDRHRPHGRGAAVHARPDRRNHQRRRRSRGCNAR